MRRPVQVLREEDGVHCPVELLTHVGCSRHAQLEKRADPHLRRRRVRTQANSFFLRDADPEILQRVLARLRRLWKMSVCCVRALGSFTARE